MRNQTKTDYANWIPVRLLTGSFTVGVALALLFALSLLLPGTTPVLILRFLLALAAVVTLLLFGYMAYAHRLLSYKGGGVQGKILDHVLHYLHWDGNGVLLDIGCGSGAMAVKAAKKYPRAQVVGIDCWDPTWGYAQSQCETNARMEGISGRTIFKRGDAAKLEFPDGYFDAAVSNFVFHEVRSQPDKLALIREALRILRPGGAFAFGDAFFSQTHYPDLQALVKELSGDVAELHFVDTRENDFVPRFLRTPMVAGEMGLIYGIK